MKTSSLAVAVAILVVSLCAPTLEAQERVWVPGYQPSPGANMIPAHWGNSAEQGMAEYLNCVNGGSSNCGSLYPFGQRVSRQPGGLDPNTGMYVEPQGSPFPSSTFNGLIQANNGSIATKLAAEAENRQLLGDQLLDLTARSNQDQLEQRKWKFAQDKKAKADEESWRQLVAAHPEWSTTQLMKAALANPGSGKDAATLSILAAREAETAAKTAPKSTEIMAELRKEVDGYMGMGFKGADIADMLQETYEKDFPGLVPPLYWQKLRSLKPTQQQVDEQLRKMNAEIASEQVAALKLPTPQLRNAAKKKVVEPLIEARDAYAMANGRASAIGGDAKRAPATSRP